MFAAAVDATRSLFDAVERRVRDAVAREMETRHRLGGAQATRRRERAEPGPAADGALRGVAAVIARTGEGRARIRRVCRRRLGGAGVGVSAFRALP